MYGWSYLGKPTKRENDSREKTCLNEVGRSNCRTMMRLFPGGSRLWNFLGWDLEDRTQYVYIQLHLRISWMLYNLLEPAANLDR
ncbi:MAG: hypothetical protein V3T42_00135 [Nitrospirales bacterium]